MSENEILQQILKNQEAMFNELNQRFDKLETKIDKLEAKVDVIEKKVNGIFEQTGMLSEFRTETNHKLDTMTVEVIGEKTVTKETSYDIAQLKAK